MTRTIRLMFVVLLGLLVSLPATARADCLLGCPPVDTEPPSEPEPEPEPEPTESEPDAAPPARKPDAKQSFPVNLPAKAQRLLDLVNSERAGRGLAPVVARADVTAIAADHSFRMAEAGSIWHNDTFFTSATKDRIGARRVGENVASNTSVEDAHRRLMLSAGHRANILDPGFTVAGFAVAADPNGTIYVTEAFSEPRRVEKATPAAVSGTTATRATPAPPSPVAAVELGPSATVPQSPAAPVAVTGQPVELAWAGELDSMNDGSAGGRPTHRLLEAAAAVLLVVAAVVVRRRVRRAQLAAPPLPARGQ